MSDGAAGPIWLVGFMACGKTEVGRRLAERMGRDFEDTDALVEREQGRSIERIFAEEGEGFFREAEWRVLEHLAHRRSLVVATGGGLFLGVAQRALMRRTGTTVWLDVPLEIAIARAHDGAARPLWIASDPIALRAMFDRRRAAYALARLRVDAATGGADEVADRVLGRIGGGIPSPEHRK